GRQNEERRGQFVMIAAHGAGTLLHGFEERGLRLGRRTVDFIRQQNVGEQRTAHESPGAMAMFVFFNDVGTGDVGGHQVRGELNALEFETEHFGHGADEQCFSGAGEAGQQAVAADEEADAHLFQNFILADDDPFHLADDFRINLAEARNSGLQNVGIDLWSGHGSYGVFPSSPLTSSSSFWAGLYSGAASSAVMASSLALSV